MSSRTASFEPLTKDTSLANLTSLGKSMRGHKRCRLATQVWPYAAMYYKQIYTHHQVETARPPKNRMILERSIPDVAAPVNAVYF